MNPENETNDIEILMDDTENEDPSSVDDFIRQLEAREKDLHITADTTIIEIAESFEDGELPEFLKQDLEKAVADQGNSAAAAAKATDRTAEFEAELAKLRASVAKMEEERAEIFKNSQRRAKDFENFKARAERERKETFQNQMGNLATFLLPALDNFNRAIDSAKQLQETKSTEFQHFFEGVVLVNEQIYDILGKMGIDTIPTVGEPFDPHLHEAVATEVRDDLPDNYVCAELLRGFRIGDRVVRHSMVKVVKNTSANELRVENEQDTVPGRDAAEEGPSAGFNEFE